MRTGFIRVLFGAYQESLDDSNFTDQLSSIIPNSCRYQKALAFIKLRRREKMDVDIQFCLQNQNQPQFTTFCFGQQNHDKLISLGIDSVLVDKEPYLYHHYQHKVIALVKAADYFDEFVLLDWDTYPIKKIDDIFWDELRSKQKLQSSLLRYRNPRLNHRLKKADNHYCPSGGFIYIGDSKLVQRLKEINYIKSTWSEEPSMGILTDEMSGGWQGLDYYRNNFEPDVYCLRKKAVYSNKNPQTIYFHNDVSTKFNG